MDMMSPTEILNKAELLPDDDSRRELAAHLRYRAQQDPGLEPDERLVASKCADSIDAMCTRPAPPQAVPPQPRSPKARRRWRHRHRRHRTYANEFEFEASVETEKILAQLTDLPRGERESTLRDFTDWSESLPGKLPKDEAVLRDLKRRLRRAIDPNQIPDDPLGDRSKITDNFGNGGFVPRRSALDRFGHVGGRLSALDHTKAGKKRRVEALKTVRHIDPKSVAIGRPRGPRPLEVPQTKHALPFEVEEKPLDIRKGPPLSAEEIARRKAAKMRQVRREAAKEEQAVRALHAKLSLPPLTAAEMKARQEREVEHEDDPEF